MDIFFLLFPKFSNTGDHMGRLAIQKYFINYIHNISLSYKLLTGNIV